MDGIISQKICGIKIAQVLNFFITKCMNLL